MGIFKKAKKAIKKAKKKVEKTVDKVKDAIEEAIPDGKQYGNDKDNKITGFHWNNKVWAKGGNDTVTVWGLKNEVDGGSGNDSITRHDRGRERDQRVARSDQGRADRRLRLHR